MLQGRGVSGAAAKIAARVNRSPQGQGSISIRAADDGQSAEILIYEEIGFDYWTGDGMTAQRLHEELAALGDIGVINVRINSPGGDVFDGLAIYNQLRRHSAHVAVDIDGLAASAASIVAMAGDTVTMGQSSLMMIHDAWSLVMGNAQDMLDFAEVLNKVDGELAATYAEKSGRPADEFRELMDKETWLSGDEAVELGLADEATTAAPQNRSTPPMTADLARRIRQRARRTVDLGA
jgi:ATP-dependent protease ClpP protease subunit